MSEITLEKVDLVRERTGVTYTEAKEALEVTCGDVVEALVYIENCKKTKNSFYTSKDELVGWLKELINKGNVTRVKIKKDDKVLVDLPITAGLAVTGIAAIMGPVVLAIGVLTAVVTKLTIEITKEDGTVEVVNKYIKSTVDDVVDKVSNMTEKFSGIASEVKDKISDITDDIKEKVKNQGSNNQNTCDDNVYKYTVKFEDAEEKDKKDEENNQ